MVLKSLHLLPRPRSTQKRCTRKRALAMIVFSVDPALLYHIGYPEDPVAVWKKLGDQFQKKTWVTKLELRRRLHSLRLKEGDSTVYQLLVILYLTKIVSFTC